jgi:hypothetical protein
MGKSPENSIETGYKLPKRNSPAALLLSAFSMGEPIITEEDCLEIADRLEKNPPADITPEGLPIILKILRGENISSK